MPEPFRGCCAVVHAGATEGYDGESPQQVYDGCFTEVGHVLDSVERADSVRRFVFTSSIAAYGAPLSEKELPMRETNVQRPEDPYGIAKLAFELDLKAAMRTFDLDFTIFRPHNVYGPRQNIADKFRNAIGIFMNQILRGEKITIFGDGKQSRAFSYIDDVAPIIAGSVLFGV